jgi:hypothetical protein
MDLCSTFTTRFERQICYSYLILWFYSCTHSYKNDEKKIVLNDSIGGHIHIINGKYAKYFCFLYRHHFLAIVTCILVLS